MKTLPDELKTPLCELLLSVADDKLMLGQRNSDWTGLGPILEEDIAFSSLAQDDLAHASALYELVAELTGDDANRLAYGRAPAEYRCAQLVELSDGFDWAVAITRQFLCDHFELLRLGRLAHSEFEPLRLLAVRLLAEERLALGHADSWVVRLGRGGRDAKDRMQAAVTRLSGLAVGLFEPSVGIERLEQAGVYPRGERDMFERWASSVEGTLERAGLAWDGPRLDPDRPGGRRGQRSAAFGELHDEMTEVYRVEPHARW
jgi:ring-1,2-phenylacetyl-CoA epoxidase subunit PaaC